MTVRCVLLFLTFSLLLPGCQSRRRSEKLLKTTIATGAPTGYYKKFCAALAKSAEAHSLEIKCLDSSGSGENVHQLAHEDAAEFALVQSDVAHHAWNGEYPFDEPQPGLRVVAPLFTERIHILVRPHQYLTSLAQLDRKKIWIGPKDSGSHFSAISLLLATGMPLSKAVQTANAGLDAKQAFTLLAAKHNDDSTPELDGVISKDVPNPGLLKEIAGSFGLKIDTMRICQEGNRIVLRRELTVRPNNGGQPAKADTTNHELLVLHDSKISLTVTSDFKARRLWIDRDVEKQVRTTVEELHPSLSNAKNASEAFTALQRGELEAIIAPDWTPELLSAVLGTRHYTVIDLQRPPEAQLRTVRNNRLMAFIRPGLDVHTPTDLMNRKLWWDESNDDVNAAIAKTIFHDASWLPTPQPVVDINQRMAMDLLAAGELDAIFQTTVAPQAAIADLLHKPSEITLFSIDWPMVEKLVADGSYVQTSFQRTAYPELSSGVYTVAVQTLLLTKLKDSGNEKVVRMVEVLREERAAIEEELSQPTALKPDGISEPFALTLLDSPLKPQLSGYVHDAARDFLIPAGDLRRGEALQIWSVIGGSTLFGIVFFGLRKKHALTSRQTVVVLLVASCLLTWAVGAILLQSLEGDITQEFVTLTAATKAIGLTTISHAHLLPNHPPVPTTRSGQIAMDFVSWLMAGLLGLAIAAIKAAMPPWLKSPWKEPSGPTVPGNGPAESAAAAD